MRAEIRNVAVGSASPIWQQQPVPRVLGGSPRREQVVLPLVATEQGGLPALEALSGQNPLVGGCVGQNLTHR